MAVHVVERLDAAVLAVGAVDAAGAGGELRAVGAGQRLFGVDEVEQRGDALLRGLDAGQQPGVLGDELAVAILLVGQLAKYEADTKRLREDLAAYRDSLVTIYDATAGQTGPVVDTINSTMRELADNDLDDNDPMFDVCQTCGPFDRDDNPMPGCRDCFGGKVVR